MRARDGGEEPGGGDGSKTGNNDGRRKENKHRGPVSMSASIRT